MKLMSYDRPDMHHPAGESPDAARPTGLPAGSRTDSGRDEDLVRRMRLGDADALGLLYDRWAPLIHPFAVHLLVNREEAEDVVEDTFWQAWRQSDRYDNGRSDVSSWLFMIARSKALMRIRARRRRREEPLPRPMPRSFWHRPMIPPPTPKPRTDARKCSRPLRSSRVNSARRWIWRTFMA